MREVAVAPSLCQFLVEERISRSSTNVRSGLYANICDVNDCPDVGSGKYALYHRRLRQHGAC